MQLDKADCVICCAAMASGRRYVEIRNAFGELYDTELGTFNIKQALRQAGIQVREVLEYRNGHPAIVSFKVWDNGDIIQSHCVYWDGTKIIDPAHFPHMLVEVTKVLEITS